METTFAQACVASSSSVLARYGLPFDSSAPIPVTMQSVGKVGFGSLVQKLAALSASLPHQEDDFQRAFAIGFECYFDEPLEEASIERCTALVELEFYCGQDGGNPLVWDIGLVCGLLAGVAETSLQLARLGAEYLANLVAKQLSHGQ
jgi:hypothetical protein